MKILRNPALLLLLLLVPLNSCNDKEKEPDAVAIKTNYHRITLGENHQKGQLLITQGNGNYRIIYPRTIEVDSETVNYSEDIVKITIEDDRVVVAELLLKDDERPVVGFFLITDARNAKKVFYLGSAGIVGDMFDEDEAERDLLNDPNYWQTDTH